MVLNSGIAQQMWTLPEALKEAENNSLAVIQANQQILQAQVDYRALKQQRIPSLSAGSNFNLNYGRTIDPTTNTFIGESNTSQTIGVNSGVQLFNGGQLHRQIQRAEANQAMAEWNKLATIQDIQLSVVDAFFQILFSKENVRIAEANLNLLLEQQSRTKIEVDAGAKAENEYLEIEAEAASAEQRKIAAENQYQLALLVFKQLLRIPIAEDVDIVFPELPAMEINDWEVQQKQEVINQVLLQAPRLKVADKEIDQAEIGIRIAQSQYSPSLSLRGSFNSNYSSARRNSVLTGTSLFEQSVMLNGAPAIIGFNEPQFRLESIPYSDQLRDNWGLGIGVSLSVPIYSQGQVKAQVEQAKIRYENALTAKEQQMQAEQERIERGFLDMRAAYRSFLAAQKTLVAANQFFENMQNSYRLGAVNNFELINAQNRKEQSEINLIIAKYDYLVRKKSIEVLIQE